MTHPSHPPDHCNDNKFHSLTKLYVVVYYRSHNPYKQGDPDIQRYSILYGDLHFKEICRMQVFLYMYVQRCCVKINENFSP